MMTSTKTIVIVTLGRASNWSRSRTGPSRGISGSSTVSMPSPSRSTKLDKIENRHADVFALWGEPLQVIEQSTIPVR